MSFDGASGKLTIVKGGTMPPPEPPSKPFWMSRTLWANLLVLIVDLLQGSYGVIPGVEPGTLTKVAAYLNIALRLMTSATLRAS